MTKHTDDSAARFTDECEPTDTNAAIAVLNRVHARVERGELPPDWLPKPPAVCAETSTFAKWRREDSDEALRIVDEARTGIRKNDFAGVPAWLPKPQMAAAKLWLEKRYRALDPLAPPAGGIAHDDDVSWPEDDELVEAGLGYRAKGWTPDPSEFPVIGAESDSLDPDQVPAVEAKSPAAKAIGKLRDKWKTLHELGGLDWFAIAPPHRRWLLELAGLDADTGERSTGVLPLGKVGMLAAAGAAGKTMALVQLALAVATGREWLDTYTTPNPGHVLLALGEEDIEEVRRRIFYAAKLMRLTDEQRQLAADRIVALPLAGTRLALTEPGAETSPVLEELTDLLNESGHEWRLIVLDPLSRFAGCDTEKDNAAATIFIEAVETLLEVPGRPTVLLAHHTNKSSRGDDGNATATNAVRGSSGLTDGARWVSQLEPYKLEFKDDEDRVTLAFSKTNYTRRLPRLVLVRCDGGALRAETEAERKEREQHEREQPKPGAGRPQSSKPPTNGSAVRHGWEDES